MNRPHIFNHMEMTIDGKVTGKALRESEIGWKLYVDKHIEFVARGYSVMAIGKNTAVEFFGQNLKVDYSKYQSLDIKYEDNIIKNNSKKYAIFFDRKGSLGWEGPIIKSKLPGYSDAQIIEIITEKTPKDHIAYYKDKGISYIFAGKEDMCIITALEKLKSLYDIDKILMEGGPTLNGAFIKEDCIDELSVLIIPCTGEDKDEPLFKGSSIKKFKLKNSQIYHNDNIIWNLYEK